MSGNISKYNSAFQEVFGVGEDELKDLEYKKTEEWNSMAHIALISALEDAFDVNFEADDIFSFSSYEYGKKLLNDRFGIKVDE